MVNSVKNKVFKEDDAVVYPLQGVGRITAITEKKFQGKKVSYYNIYLKASEMTIMIPIEKSANLGIRKIISKRRAEMLLDAIEKEKPYVFASDWKIRYQNSVENIRSGTLIQIVSILRALYLRSKTKDLPIMERKLYDSSFQALIMEFSLATRTPEEDIKKKLIEKFNIASAE